MCIQFLSIEKSNFVCLQTCLAHLSLMFGWEARCYILSISDSRHKPVYIPRICRVSQITPCVADGTCSAVILGERTQLHRGHPAVMVHRLCRPVGMEASRRCIPLGVALSIWTLVCMVVWVHVWPGVGEPGMCSRAGWQRSPAWLALENWGSQAAGTGSVRGPLWTKGPAGLLHPLWPLTSKHTAWSWVSHEVIDAEHAVLTWSERRRWWGGVVGRR